MQRRTLLRFAVSAPLLNLGRVRLFGAEYSTRAVDVVKSSTVIDMLSPFALSSSKSRQWLSKPESFTASDLANYRASGIHAGGTLEVEKVAEASRYAPLVTGSALEHEHLAVDSGDRLLPVRCRNVGKDIR